MGTDWAMDIGASPNQDAYLNIGMAGWAAGGLTPDNNLPISLSGSVQYGGGVGACEYRNILIRVSYWDTAGVFHATSPVGEIFIEHLYNWRYGTGAEIPGNVVESNPNGSGTITVISQLLGAVYPSGGPLQ
jgi:hypothetical protein